MEKSFKINVLTSVLLSATFIACATPVATATARYDYAVGAERAPASGLTFGFLEVSAPSRQAGSNGFTGELVVLTETDPTVANMIAAVDSSIVELALAKGMRVTGVYPKLTEMTYPEKKAAAIVLRINLDSWPSITCKALESSALTTVLGNVSTYTLIAPTRYTLAAYEPISHETLWTKHGALIIDTPPPFRRSGAACSSNLTYSSQWVALNESTFKAIMSTLDKHISVEEMKSLAKFAKELRSKKVY